MNLELVAPATDRERKQSKANLFRLSPLTLPLLAALTPKDVEVSITDEAADGPVNFEKDVDLVGITSMTYQAPRAYEIADEFKQRGVTVIMGGSHATAAPHEAKEHADAVVIGEADNLWRDIIADYRKGGLKEFYKAPAPPDLRGLPFPRLDLLKRGKYRIANVVQASRGCPFNCDFCFLPFYYGGGIRYRPVEDVAEEIAALEGKLVIFWDENIVGNPEYAKKLFRALIPHKKLWLSQSTATIVQDKELLSLAAKSGCIGLYIGFETTSSASLNAANKLHNKELVCKDVVDKLHDHGITVMAGMVHGFDTDDKTIFERTVEFVNKVNLDGVSPSVLTPYPGTKLYQRLRQEDRIIDNDWSYYDCDHVVFRPKLMTPEELFSGNNWVRQECHTAKSILKRLISSHTRLWLSLPIELDYRRYAYTMFERGTNPARIHG
ncbi:TPA: B12-binding domain-containing radical SAM protein [Candidatus Poribacteria bacterium]|nr:B12-binding domain-containing radical SAM protein [Candidatus Poribacteria bacterium]